MENLSLQTKTRFPKDLLHRFTVDDGVPRSSDPEEDRGSGSGEEVELNLGLSLGGRFGVDKSNSKLMRSSSIAAILPVVRDDDVLGSGHENPNPNQGRAYSGLIRTSSLPVETEEEWRKRKELQSLRRLAAKRRRSEKQRSLTRGEREEYVAAMSRVGSSASPGPPFRSDKWPPSGGMTAVGGTGTSKSGGGGGGSMSEFEGRKHRQGSSGRGGETSTLLQESSSPRVGLEGKNTWKEMGSMEDMPCVFTQGDGPNGRVVEGILYKYGKGEQVKIMCVCHGSFLSPAEFVKHAGGTDFLHPLKHIVVKPTSSFS
ncbi:hypothetical protein L1987_72920 [Smallanthus sonchifolius]|uniref:Uncharacterized protein n=1 Tax=Smallanthus sonchifolius TaxID=185202 RepID=A0ACB9AX94_9ASTR|nr:hypothetical protein L1987_72920 [Smallanthus sonchifolius]